MTTVIFNLSKKTVVAKAAFRAVRLSDRARGMIGRSFHEFDAMVFGDCSAIHTFFMRIPIDVIFLDRENTVLKICRSLKPWRPAILARGGKTVIELPAGALNFSGTMPGDRLDLDAVSAADPSKSAEINSAAAVPCGEFHTDAPFRRSDS